jgi:hypothetical protein
MKLKLIKKRFESQSLCVSYPSLVDAEKKVQFPSGSFSLTKVGEISPIDLPDQIAYDAIARYSGFLEPVIEKKTTKQPKD